MYNAKEIYSKIRENLIKLKKNRKERGKHYNPLALAKEIQDKITKIQAERRRKKLDIQDDDVLEFTDKK